MKFDDLNRKEYEILERLGGNRLFNTFLARQVNLGRYVVIRQIISSEIEASQRFCNELAALSSLQHPNNARVIDAGAATIGGVHGPYIVLEYLAGESLSEVLLRRSNLDTIEVVSLGQQILGALAEAHRYGLLHRQLSPPALLMLHPEGLADHVTVIDYAIEHAVHPEAWLESTLSSGYGEYMAPELLRGDPPTIRSDIFSVAALLARCTTGAKVLESPESTTEVELIKPSFEGIGGLKIELLEVFEKAMHHNPERRFGTATEFLEALDPIHEKLRRAAIAPVVHHRPSAPRLVSNFNPDESAPPLALTDNPSIWVLTGDPALDAPFIDRIKTIAAHYEIEEISREDAAVRAKALLAGELKQPWLVAFGDLHVIVQSRVLHAVRDLPITQRLLISAKLNGQMLEAAVNYCGVDKHLVLPIDIVALSEVIEARLADCRRQLLRHQILHQMPHHSTETALPRFSITGEFAAETRLDP